MAKPKTLEQLRAEKERAETQLAQEQHKLQYYEKGERQKRTTAFAIWAALPRVLPRRIEKKHPHDRNHTDA